MISGFNVFQRDLDQLAMMSLAAAIEHTHELYERAYKALQAAIDHATTRDALFVQHDFEPDPSSIRPLPSFPVGPGPTDDVRPVRPQT